MYPDGYIEWDPSYGVWFAMVGATKEIFVKKDAQEGIEWLWSMGCRNIMKPLDEAPPKDSILRPPSA